jgi:hypothetical protein
MWHALRAELDYFRMWLLGAWSIAFAVALLLNLLVLFGAGDGPPSIVAAGLPGMFMVIAAMVVGFIAQGMRSEERRARLLLAGPLTPRQLGWVMVLIPAILVTLGVLAGGLLIGVVSLVTGRFDLQSVGIVGGVAAQLFAIAQMGPLAQESTAARRQQRTRAALFGWALFAASILFLAAAQWYLKSIAGLLGQVALAAAAMIAAATLYAGRTDFTR